MGEHMAKEVILFLTKYHLGSDWATSSNTVENIVVLYLVS